MTKRVTVGNVPIGGGADVSIQSMTNTPTADIPATLRQIEALEHAGCEIIRLAVPDTDSAGALSEIVRHARVPLVADIHFDYRLALKSIENGIAKVRINPGNIGSAVKVRELVSACKDAQIPIRIGVNGGSLPKDLLAKYGGITADGMVEAALRHIVILEKEGYRDIVVSLKASTVPLTVRAYEIISERIDYSLHLGVTEAGLSEAAVVKSAMGIGALLLRGIGDTLRVSLTGDPVREVAVAKDILQAAGLRKFKVEIVSCPTCARCAHNLEGVVKAVEARLGSQTKPIKIAIMGCVVNGPGEAREADVGMACGKDKGLLFSRGEVLRTVPMDSIVEELIEEAQRIGGRIDL